MSVRPYDLGWIPGTAQTLNPITNTYSAGKTPLPVSVSSSASESESSDLSSILSQLSSSLTKTFQDISTSSLKAEQDAAAKANALTYQMFKESQDYNSREALKAFERDQTSAQKSMAFEQSERLASQDWYENLSNTSYQRAVSDLKAAGLNPALALSGLSGASSAMSSPASGSTASANAASVSGGSAQKANPSSANQINANLISKVLAALVDVYQADLNSSTSTRNTVLNGTFHLLSGLIK